MGDCMVICTSCRHEMGDTIDDLENHIYGGNCPVLEAEIRTMQLYSNYYDKKANIFQRFISRIRNVF